MSYIIAQDDEQRKLSFSLQSQADIEAVSLVEATAKCKSKLDNAKYPLAFSVEFEPEDAKVEGRFMTVRVRFTFTVTDKDKVDVIVVKCLLSADYELAAGFRPSRNAINAFKQGNAIFNCWPYFREYVQNTVVRMNYPPPTIPFLRLMPMPSKLNGATAKTRSRARKAVKAEARSQR